MQFTLFSDPFIEQLAQNSRGILAKPLQIAVRLLETNAGVAIVRSIEGDLKEHTRLKKIRRANAGKGTRAHSRAGRKRTAPEVVYLLVVASGVIDSSFGKRGYAQMAGSADLHRALAQFGVTRVPSRSTCHELITAVSPGTMQALIQAQLELAKQEQLDDFQTVIGDSTATEADSAKPNNARLLVRLAERARKHESKLRQLLGVQRGQKRLDKNMQQLQSIRYLLQATSNTTRQRTRRYGKLLEVAGRVIDYFESGASELDPGDNQALLALWTTYADSCAALEEMWCQIYEELYPGADLGEPVRYCHSLADPDACFIKKGHRPTVFGYRVQLACSDGGFMVGMMLPRGNQSDALSMPELVDCAKRWTGVTPCALSLDSGYCSKANLKTAQDQGIAHVCFAGSKGKALLADVWDTDMYKHLRKRRNVIEALIGHHKQNYCLKRFYERDLESAQHQLLRCIIAYNFERIAFKLIQRHRLEALDAAA